MSKKEKKEINLRTKAIKLRQVVALGFMGAFSFMVVVELVDSVAWVENTVAILVVALLFSALVD